MEERVRLHAARHTYAGVRSVASLLAETRRMAIFLITMLIVVITARIMVMRCDRKKHRRQASSPVSFDTSVSARRDAQKRAHEQSFVEIARAHARTHARALLPELPVIMAGRSGGYGTHLAASDTEDYRSWLRRRRSLVVDSGLERLHRYVPDKLKISRSTIIPKDKIFGGRSDEQSKGSFRPRRFD